MPVNSKDSTGVKTKTNGSKTSGEVKSSTGKKQGTTNLKVPSAREKAKDSDERRRSDANSNEL